MRAPNFAVVAALSPEEQSSLLEGGDGPERLWSAWAIALRLGRDALPLLRSTEGSDIPDGLRRQLLVVLAGMGERGAAPSDRRLGAVTVRAGNSIDALFTHRSGSIELRDHLIRVAPAADPPLRQSGVRFLMNRSLIRPASQRGNSSTLRDPNVAVRIACASAARPNPARASRTHECA